MNQSAPLLSLGTGFKSYLVNSLQARHLPRILRLGPGGPLVTLCVLFAVACQAQYTIRTIAGGRSPDNLPATAVAIGTPFGVAVGPDGNLFISSDSRNEVYRLGSDGVIHLIALNPTGSKNENDLTFPNGIAADDKGNVYIASPFNNLVRKIDP